MVDMGVDRFMATEVGAVLQGERVRPPEQESGRNVVKISEFIVNIVVDNHCDRKSVNTHVDSFVF
jgi:hypothetical protein